tara:strand:- start:85 stop:1023 length:939 start_codon:yes stop_codon:yes gene_type:complete
MADKKISALTGATTPLAGTEVLPIVQSGATVKVAISDVTAGRAVSMSTLNTTSGAVIGNTFVPSTTTVNYTSAEFGYSGSGIIGATNGTDWFITANTAQQTGWKAVRTATATRVEIWNDGVDFTFAPSVIAGSAQTFTTKFTVEPTGVTVTGVNLVIGTSGKGIDFSATSHPAGMTSELLSDYEEGTWTPVIRGASTAGTYEQTVTRALYTKIGRQVTLQCYITLASVVTGGGTGYLQITGAPFTAFSPNQFATNILLTDMAKSLTTLYVGVSWANTTVMYFPEVQPTTTADFPVANAVANKTIQFTMTYFV